MSLDEPSAAPLARRLLEGGRPLAALLLLATLVKLLALAAALADDPLARLATSDERYYLERAAGLAGLGADPLAGQPHHLPPLYPWVLRLVPGALQGQFGGVMALQLLAGVGLLAAVYLLARRRASRLAALVATALCLLYGPLTFFELKLLGDSLACVLLVAALLVADELADRGGGVRALLLGALVGLVALLRPQALLLALLLVPWVLRRRGPAPAVLAALAALVVLLPATLHNLATSGDLIPVSDNGGVNLWLANTGPLSGTFVTHDKAFANIDDQAAVAGRRAEEQVGHPLSAGAVSHWYTRQALAAIVADPSTFLHRVGLRARALLESFETGIVAIPQVEMGTIPPLTVLGLPFGVLAGLALAACVLGWRRGTAPWGPMAAVAAMVVVTTLVFFHYSRFRLPLVPLLAIVAARSLDRVRAQRPGPGRLLAAGLACAATIAVAALPAPHHAPTLANGWTSLGDARLRTARPGDRAALERAHADALTALDHDPGFVRAGLLAAHTALALGRYDECAGFLAQAARTVPDDEEVLVTGARLALDPSPANDHYDPDRAQALLDRMALDPGLEAVRRSLERALGQARTLRPGPGR